MTNAELSLKICEYLEPGPLFEFEAGFGDNEIDFSVDGCWMIENNEPEAKPRCIVTEPAMTVMLMERLVLRRNHRWKQLQVRVIHGKQSLGQAVAWEFADSEGLI